MRLFPIFFGIFPPLHLPSSPTRSGIPWKSGAFFVQPGVVYRYVGENSPESYYTSHPWSFRISAGYRIIF
jgi:hypothetical protein